MNATLAEFQLNDSNMYLYIWDKGFVDESDEGQIGFYVYHDEMERECNISREMAEKFYNECTDEFEDFADLVYHLNKFQVKY